VKNAFLDKFLDRLARLDAGDVQAQFLRLAAEKGLLETIFHSLREGLLVLDPERHITFANRAACRMFGIPDDPRKTPRTLDGLAPDVDWAGLFTEATAPQGMATREIEVFRPQHRYLEIYLAPLAPGPGNDAPRGQTGAVLLLRDVTRDRDSARELIESERLNAIVLLAAGVAHEIGNPLNSLGIHLQLLEREIDGLPESDDRESLASHVRIAKSEIARLDRILSQFLKALRPGNPDCKAMPLPPALRETLATLETEIADRGIAVAVADPPASLPDAWADATQVQQAFYNVIRNAIQAMDSGGRLDISFGTTRHMVWVAFRDNGPGIPSDRMGELFQPFSSTKRNGHGMGLMIVQRILRDHGGNVVLETSPAGTRIQLNFQCDGPRMLLLDASSPAP